MEKERTLRFLAEIDFKTGAQFKAKLLEENIRYKQWLKDAITEFLQKPTNKKGET